MIIKNKHTSFTLIELLVVIVIIGILAGVIMISTSSSIDKANFAKAQAFSSTVQNELLSNLVSEWTFDNASNLGEDSWGNNNGTLYGAAGSQNLPQLQSLSECVFGTCLKFDGVDDTITINNAPTLCFEKKDITISLFAKIKVDCPLAMIINKGSAISRFWITYNPSGNSIRINSYFGTGKDYWLDGDIKLNDDKWHYVVVTYDRDGYERLYIDGNFRVKLDISGAASDSWDSINPFQISSATYPTFFKGLLDDIRIYETVLSSFRIKQNYIAGLNFMLSNENISKEEYNERINTLAYEK